MWLFEDDVRRSEIHNLWDAFFFTTVQLLTVSSQMPNPVTTGGRIVDIVLELTALFLVSGIAGAFASFFLHLGAKQTDELGGLRERLVAHGAHVPRARRARRTPGRRGAASRSAPQSCACSVIASPPTCLEPQSMIVSSTG